MAGVSLPTFIIGIMLIYLFSVILGILPSFGRGEVTDLGFWTTGFLTISGLKAIIAIHNTVLGPALGGCRMYPYKSEEDALVDVLRLSRGMTYKASISNLNLGGGKAVIIGDPS